MAQKDQGAPPEETPAATRRLLHAHTVTAAEIARRTEERATVERPRTIGDNAITFLPLAHLDASALGYTVHIKGFASRIDFDSEDTKAEVAKLLDFVDKRNPDTLVWDGDDFATGSFTYLIPMIHDRTRPRLVCFLRDAEEERSRLVQSWGELCKQELNRHLPITCYLCREDMDFRELGGEALRATHSRAVICFGGGGVVKDEYAHADASVTYINVSVSRRRADGDGLEHAGLDKELLQTAAHQNLINIQNADADAPRNGELARTVSG